MKLVQQVPRNALVWMIICLFTLMAPHASRVPLWVLAVYVFAAAWRIQVYRGRWSFPGRWVKAVMTLSGFAGIYISYGSLIGLEPTVALLLTAFALNDKNECLYQPPGEDRPQKFKRKGLSRSRPPESHVESAP